MLSVCAAQRAFLRPVRQVSTQAVSAEPPAEVHVARVRVDEPLRPHDADATESDSLERRDMLGVQRLAKAELSRIDRFERVETFALVGGEVGLEPEGVVVIGECADRRRQDVMARLRPVPLATDPQRDFFAV